jgi:ComF family protein
MVYQRLKNVQNFLFPGSCELCRRRIDADQDFCSECKHSLPAHTPGCRICAAPLWKAVPETTQADNEWVCGRCQQHPPAFTSAIAAFAYQEPINNLILDLKYHRKLYLARVLGSLLADVVVATISSPPDIVLPIPLHRTRLRSRGYNQAYELARPVARRTGLAVDPWRLQRVRKTPSQTDLPRRQRAKNVRGAFAVCGDVDDLRIALVDDVMTTGHTASAAADALLKAGARSVEVWLLARA